DARHRRRALRRVPLPRARRPGARGAGGRRPDLTPIPPAEAGPLAQSVNDQRAIQRLDPETRPAQLVAAAVAAFHGREPDEVSVEEVAEAAGVSRSLLYAYFGDRGGLVAEVYLHSLRDLDAELAKALDDGLTDEAQLRRIVRRYLVFARDNEPTWTLINR